MGEDTIRFVHTADLHLGSPHPGLGKLGGDLSRESLEDFLRLLEYCQDQKVDLLLIAGDFLEAGFEESIRASLLQGLARLTHTQVFIAPGNHDPYLPGSPYQIWPWPESVHIFTEDFTCFSLLDGGVEVCGSAFRSPHQPVSFLEQVSFPENSLEKFGQSARRIFRIYLVHADLVHGQGESVYNPLDLSKLPPAYFDYVALGHIHRRSEPVRRSGTSYAYSGCLTPTGFDEPGVKGFYLGRVQQGMLSLTFKPWAKLRFIEKELHLDGLDSIEKVEQGLKSMLVAGNQNAYRFHLKGASPFVEGLPMDYLRTHFAGEGIYLELLDESLPAVSWDAIRQEKSIRGAVVNLLLQKQEHALRRRQEEEVQLSKRALELVWQAFQGREVDVGDKKDFL